MGALRRGLKPRPFKTHLAARLKTGPFQNAGFAAPFDLAQGTLLKPCPSRSRSRAKSKASGQECPLHTIKVKVNVKIEVDGAG